MESTVTVYTNGNVITMEKNHPIADSFGVANDKLLFVGSKEDGEALIRNGAKVVDLKGRTVIPGFIETHCHISSYTVKRLQVDCSPDANSNIYHLMCRIQEHCKTKPPGTWIQGGGYDDTLISDKRHITKDDLDEAAPEHPVVIKHICGHIFYANSKALQMSGISNSTPQPKGGEFHKNERGRLTGIMLELGAANVVLKRLPPFDEWEFLKEFEKSISYFNSCGVTSCHDAAIGYTVPGTKLIKFYRGLELDNKLSGLRIYLTILENIYRDIVDKDFGRGFGSNHLKLGSVKLFQDGSIQALTAALSQPYYSKPNFCGNLIMDQEVLDEIVYKYHSMGLQIAIHANGDRAIGSAIESIQKAMDRCEGFDNRHLIIHCQTATDEQIESMKSLNIIPNFFVNHVYYWGDRHREIFLGDPRASRIDPLKVALQKGLKFLLHSDCPVTPVEPIFSIHTAVNRITREGKVLGPEFRVNPFDALEAYTTNAAYASFEECLKGSITPGKLADFVVLSDNPLTVASDKIRDIRVLTTVVGGKPVYTEEMNKGSSK